MVAGSTQLGRSHLARAQDLLAFGDVGEAFFKETPAT